MGTILGVVHGKTIELNEAPNLPDGQRVVVQLQPAEEPPPKWLEHFTVDPAIAPAKIIIKGTRLLAEEMAKLIDEGHRDDDLRQMHPELTAEDIDALRHYVQVPVTLRRLFGAWADDAEELDKFLEERRLQRQIHRREIDE
ncbi:MAG: hypothetical protein B7Z73_08375 [Planctomycetia bacterium 21-64-5]|nr:MAG: hypothetical protein B7Z73_08375 [Planctomycetia bacterium 21-64-5]HQU41978.1 DUF433 domain-containing protein [Pirellulales bacterium]